MSIRATVKMFCTVVETLAASVPFISNTRNSVTHDGLNEEKTLTATSTFASVVLPARRRGPRSRRATWT